MRTFSRLRATCSHPELIDLKPKPRRDAAADLGKQFHRYLQTWTSCLASGAIFFDDGATGEVRTWLKRLRATWTPPAGLESETPLGLMLDPMGRLEYAAVTEEPEESHNYLPLDPAVTLLTAGRADFIAPNVTYPNVLHVDDVKTGRFYLGPPDRIVQVLAQGIAATLRAKADGFVPGIYYPRVNVWDRGKMILRWTPEWDEVEGQVIDAARRTDQPTVGAHCLSCWCKADCKANPEVRP